jgi:predicted dienelactone hydrolase
MRPLEIAVTVALLPYVLHLLSPSRGESVVFSLLAFIAALLAICHVVVEGYRWQMFPAYCLAIVFVVYECTRWFWVFRAPYCAGVAALLFELAAITLSTALPIFRLPAPTGPYKIGTEIRHIVDEGRWDPFSDYPNSARELMIQIWYPVDPSMQGPVAPYRDRRITTLWDAHFALVESHSIIGAQLSHSQSRYPLLLYTPSWSGIRTESTFQVEELASHGYIVVGIDHPYSSRITVFPDGRIARRKFSGEEDYSSQAAFEAFVKTADQQVEIRAHDASFVLDTLEHLNANDPQGLLTGHLDLARVGIFGSSLGGGTAAQACWLDRRFRAGVDMGGMIAGESAKQGTFAPFFFMFEGLYDDPPYAPETDLSSFDPSKRRDIEFTLEQFAQMKRSLSEYGGYWMVIPGLKHMNFFDSPFFSPLRYGRVDLERTSRTISRYTLAFFDKHLKGIEQPLLDGPSPDIPEVRFQVWKAKAPVAHLGR